MRNYSNSHSFDKHLASEYGIEEAIIIHHFQHWIEVNQRLKRNFIDGRTWTYQTREEIAANFPYMDEHKVRRITDNLVKLGILRKGNFNKSKMDKTIWYAFENEEMFTIGKFANSIGNSANSIDENAKAIPDTKPNTKPDIEAKASCSSPIGSELATLLFESIKKTKPDIKNPNLKVWEKELDRMIRLDKREVGKVKKMIAWLPNNNFWSKNILSADKLREKYDRLELEMNNVKTSPNEFKEKIKDKFKHGQKYMGAECFIDSQGIAFQRGMHHKQVKWSENGLKEQVLNLLRTFGIQYE